MSTDNDATQKPPADTPAALEIEMTHAQYERLQKATADRKRRALMSLPASMRADYMDEYLANYHDAQFEGDLVSILGADIVKKWQNANRSGVRVGFSIKPLVEAVPGWAMPKG